MPSTASQAGTAAPTPAAVALPSYVVSNFTGRHQVEVEAVAARPMPVGVPQIVRLCAAEGPLVFNFGMTPAAARDLAVALVDCANALDNPAERVILDDTPAWPLKPCQDMGAPRVRAEGEGIGHE